MIGEIEITAKMGGEIEKVIKEFKGKKVSCTCSKTFKIEKFCGYPHSDGFESDTGKKWWIYVTCPHCCYDWAIWKLRFRVKNNGETY